MELQKRAKVQESYLFHLVVGIHVHISGELKRHADHRHGLSVEFPGLVALDRRNLQILLRKCPVRLPKDRRFKYSRIDGIEHIPSLIFGGGGESE